MINIPGRVREALKSGMYKKNYRVLVYDASGELIKTLNNDNLIKESVKLDERMCSGETITFGLCEGSSLEFQYFNYDNINGKRIKLMLDVEYLAEDGTKQWYEMPMGYFDVAQCPMQFSTGVYKVTAYNKLKSKYLDADMSKEIISIVEQGEEGGTTGEATVDTILYNLLSDYAIEEYYSQAFANKRPTNKYANVYTGDVLHSLYRYDSVGQMYYRVGSLNTLSYRKTFTLSNITAGDYVRFYLKQKAIHEYIYNTVFDGLKNYYVDTEKKVSDCILSQKLGSEDIFVSKISAFGLFNIPFTKSNPREEILSNYKVVGNDVTVTIEYVFWAKILSGWRDVDHLYADYGTEIDAMRKTLEDMIYSKDYMRIDKRFEKQGSKIEITNEDLENIKNGITLRDMQSALFEMNCQFGRLDRDTDLFAGLDLNNNRLLPADNLYPSNTLVPLSNSERTDASAYEKLWTDSSGVQSFRKLYITYRGLDEEGRNVEYVLKRTVNANGTQDYNMSDNWLFKNLTWTAEQVGQYADVIVAKMRNISWFPFEAWCAGLPYLEPGDELEISNSEGTYTSYILQRQLSGIQMLKDTYINGELDIF